MSVWTRRNREEEKGSDQREKSEKYSRGRRYEWKVKNEGEADTGRGKALRRRERDSKRKEATIKMKNDILADIPAAISLAPLGSYIPYPSGQANSLPTWNYWWFFKSVKQASRPQSAQGFPFLRDLHLSFSRGIQADFSCPNVPALSPLARTTHGPSSPVCLAPCYLFFKLSTFHPLVPLLYSRWSSATAHLDQRFGRASNRISTLVFRLSASRKFHFNASSSHSRFTEFLQTIKTRLVSSGWQIFNELFRFRLVQFHLFSLPRQNI